MHTVKLSDRDSFEENIIKEKSETVDSIGRFLLIKLLTFARYLLDLISEYLKKRRARVLAEKVFNNRYLVEKIVRNIPLMDYYSTRAVNKTFNCAVLGILRKDNRIMKLELKHYAQTNPVKDVYVVLINLTPLFLPYCAYYFKFLNKIVGVQVEQLEVIDLWKLTLKPSDAHLFKKFHEDIHSELIGNNHVKSLIGLEDVSNNCLECVEIARKCLEYGPIDEFWMQIDFGKHFGKIVLTDVFLDKIASSCVSDSESKEDCYKMLEDRFSKPNISCTTLTLCIHENRDTDNTMIHQNHTPIPWEALEMALKKWKVQSIEIKFTLIPRLPMRQPADFFSIGKCANLQPAAKRDGKHFELKI